MYTVMDTSLWDIDLICMSWNFCETLLIDLKLNSPTLNIVTKIQNSWKIGIIQYCFWQVGHMTTWHFLQITLYGWSKVKCDKSFKIIICKKCLNTSKVKILKWNELFVNLSNKYTLDRNNLYIYNIDEPNN